MDMGGGEFQMDDGGSTGSAWQGAPSLDGAGTASEILREVPDHVQNHENVPRAS
jgi:hypothetical protein